MKAQRMEVVLCRGQYLVINMKILLSFCLWFLVFTNELLAERFHTIIVNGEVKHAITGVNIESFEVINDDEVLVVARNSYLVLVDTKANIFEFFGERKISLDTLKGSSLSTFKPPKFETLVLEKRQVVNVIDDSNPVVEIYYPFFFSNIIEVRDSLSLKWLNLNQVELKIISEFDDLIYKKVLSNNETVITFSNVDKKYKNLIVRIEPLGGKKNQTVFKRISFSAFHHKYDNINENMNSAAANLLSALFFESKGQITEAYIYYKRANLI